MILSELKRKLAALSEKHPGVHWDVDMTWNDVTITGFTREASCGIMLSRVECESAVMGEDWAVDRAVERILGELQMSPRDAAKHMLRAIREMEEKS